MEKPTGGGLYHTGLARGWCHRVWRRPRTESTRPVQVHQVRRVRVRRVRSRGVRHPPEAVRGALGPYLPYPILFYLYIYFISRAVVGVAAGGGVLS